MEVIRLCRLCLTFSEYHANIFFEKIKDKQLWRLVNSVCELNTFLYDGLPEHICVDCEYTLKKTLSFRNRAIEASSALKLMIQRNKDLWEKSELDASKSSKATPKAVQLETLEGTKAVVQPPVATPPSTRFTTVNKWEKLDASKSCKAIPKAVKVETPEGTKAVFQPPVATPPSRRSTTMNKVSGVSSVGDASPKKSKRQRSPGKSSQRKSNPPSPRRTRTVKVEMPSCDNSKQGPSSKKDRMQQSLSEHQSGAEKKVARPFVCQQCGASYVRKHFLQKHEVAHRNKWTCTTSSQRLPSKRDLNSHMQFHSHVRPSSARSSDLRNFPSLEASKETARKSFEGESSSICTSKDNSIEIRHTNKTITGKDLRADVVTEEESDGLSKSILNDTKSELSHLRAHVSMSLFVCDICKKSFKRKEHLGRHVKVHNYERPFSCNVCDKTFRWDFSRYRHELTHMRDKMKSGNSEKGSNKKQFSCTVCGKNFSAKILLNRHSNMHTDKYKCIFCGKCFGDNCALKTHLRTHTKEKPFKCKVCSKCFSQKSSLKAHLHTHSSERPFSCDICCKRLKTKLSKSTRSSDLKNFPSLEATEGTARTSFEGESSSVCTPQDNSIEIRHTNKTINGKDLRADVVTEEESDGLTKSILNETKSELSQLKAPLSKSVFVCDICKKSFKTKQNLGKHLKVHNDERPFSCNKCDKTFKWDMARYRHELRHVRDKMSSGKSLKGTNKLLYSCDLCAKNFSSKFQLYRHSNLHRNKYKCNTCGKCFGENGILMTHLRTHTKEKPFKCEVCFKCFNRKGVLNTHLLSHSSDKPFLCDICDKGFKSKTQKNVHALIHLRKK